VPQGCSVEDEGLQAVENDELQLHEAVLDVCVVWKVWMG
jgi:hypothetical protein